MWMWIAIALISWMLYQRARMTALDRDVLKIKELYEALRKRLSHLESGVQEVLPCEPKPELEPEPLVEVEPATLPVFERPVPTSESVSISVPEPEPKPQPEPEPEPEVVAAPAPPKPVAVKAPAVVKTKDELEDRWGHLEQVLGLKWTTWVGGLILFLGAGLFVKYSFDRAWLGPWTKVGLSTLAGCALLAAGEWGLKRKMIWFGQGLVGIGLAILYMSAFGTYAFYDLLQPKAVYGVMIAVTVMGMGQAIRHDALSMAFLAVLGGFLTPILLSSGDNARDALFAYVLLLDLGVLAVAWFKRWRALDVLAFGGTWLLFMKWFYAFEATARLNWVPTVLWLVAFFVVFLVVPFLYHLRRATPVTGERFFLAVTNAVGLFGGLYVVLHEGHRGLLSVMTLGMSLAYLGMGLVIRQRIKADAKAALGCAALFMSLLTLAIPIAMNLHGVTMAWAVEGPLLLFLACLYPYKPVRVASVVPWCLAVVRLFVFHWPMHTEAFTLFLNPGFGTAMFVVLAGGVFVVIHRRHARDDDHICARQIVGLATAFLGLFMVHNELWLWLGFEGQGSMQCWLCALVWTAGAAGFGWLCTKIREPLWYWAGITALCVSAMLCLWAYTSGSRGATLLVLNGRFLVAVALLTVLGVFGKLSQSLDFTARFRPSWGGDKFGVMDLAERLYVLCALLGACLCHGELFFWLKAHDYAYAMRWALPLIWVLAGVVTLVIGQRFGLKTLRALTLLFAGVASCWMVWSYTERLYHSSWLYLNLRFAVALASAALFFVYGFVLQRSGDLTKALAEKLYMMCVVMVTCLCHEELFLWLRASDYIYAIRWATPWIWVLVGAGTLYSGQRFGLKNLRSLPLAFATVAAILVAWSFVERTYHPRWLYLNLRFVAALAGVGLLMAHGFVLRRYEDLQVPAVARLAFSTFVAGAVLLFVWLNAETYLFAIKQISVVQQARWAAHMGISLVWGVYASGLLIFGFAKQVRVARLSALGLFGLTALKLVFVDLAGVQEIYRIISFVVLGLLIIAASYLYHRAEKQLS